MDSANDHGFTIIRLLQTDVFNNTNNWEVLLKNAINYSYKKPTRIFIESGNLYDCYK